MQHLLESKFTLGGNAEVAAGPVGEKIRPKPMRKTAQRSLTYSRSRGLFAGVSLSGATLRNDVDTNKELYGRPLHNKQILMQGIKPPVAAQGLLNELNQYSHVQGSQHHVPSRQN